MRTPQPCTENKMDIIPFFPEIQTQKKPKILIVEKNSADAVIAQKLLSLLNYQETVIAANGKEAIQLFSNSHFDMVILGMNLPDINEIEVCRQMRSLCSDEYLPILIYTEFSEKIETENLRQNFDDFLFKPPRLDDFQCVIQRCVP